MPVYGIGENGLKGNIFFRHRRFVASFLVLLLF